jgi:hypothetical protein
VVTFIGLTFGAVALNLVFTATGAHQRAAESQLAIYVDQTSLVAGTCAKFTDGDGYVPCTIFEQGYPYTVYCAGIGNVGCIDPRWIPRF